MIEESSASSRYPWVVMLIGVPDALFAECAAAASPIPVIRVLATNAALEEILNVRPIVVVVGPDVEFDLLQSVRIRASATRAALVDLPIGTNGADLEAQIRTALTRAEAARVAVRARRASARGARGA